MQADLNGAPPVGPGARTLCLVPQLESNIGLRGSCSDAIVDSDSVPRAFGTRGDEHPTLVWGHASSVHGYPPYRTPRDLLRG
jgi:hypothetical protein